MKRPWHLQNPELLQRTRVELEERYPDLHLSAEINTVYVRGSFPVEHGGEVLDRFQIQVELPAEWPSVTPVLRETGGRIPWSSARHVNHDGVACPLVPEEWLLSPNRDSLVTFLDGPVRNFFIGQSLFEAGEPLPFGERPHDRDGLLQSYGELLGVEDEPQIRRFLEVLSRHEVKGHWDCPCVSGIHLRKCHMEKVQQLRKRVPPSVAAQALKRLG
jgi:hypothetical protein